MIGLALAACGGAGSALVALGGLARVRRAAPPRDAPFRRGTESLDLTRALVSAFPEQGTEIAAALATGASALAVQLLNEALADVDRELRAGLEVTRPSARIALAFGTLGAVMEAITGLSSERAVTWVLAAPAFLFGAAGAAACFELSRRTAATASEARADWDRLATEIGRRLTRAS